MRVSRTMLAAALACTTIGAIAGTAMTASADTVASPVGTVTAEQYQGTYCDDLGAHVRVTVTAGTPGASYTASGSGFWHPTASFVTDASGAGLVDLHNVRTSSGSGVGTAAITVNTAGTTVSVAATINCPGQKGD